MAVEQGDREAAGERLSSSPLSKKIEVPGSDQQCERRAAARLRGPSRGYTREEQGSLLEELEASGESVESFCARTGVVSRRSASGGGSGHARQGQDERELVAALGRR